MSISQRLMNNPGPHRMAHPPSLRQDVLGARDQPLLFGMLGKLGKLGMLGMFGSTGSSFDLCQTPPLPGMETERGKGGGVVSSSSLWVAWDIHACLERVCVCVCIGRVGRCS